MEQQPDRRLHIPQEEAVGMTGENNFTPTENENPSGLARFAAWIATQDACSPDWYPRRSSLDAYFSDGPDSRSRSRETVRSEKSENGASA